MLAFAIRQQFWNNEFLLALKQTFPKNYDEVEGCTQQQRVTNDHFCPRQ